jgi:hypothetical protein
MAERLVLSKCSPLSRDNHIRTALGHFSDVASGRSARGNLDRRLLILQRGAD